MRRNSIAKRGRPGEPPPRPGRLPDRVGPRLDVLFVGINPGLRSAAVGHHYAGRSNRFWRLLHESRLTAGRLDCTDDARLPRLGFGLTNLVSRPTAGSADLETDEFARGARLLRRKIRRLRPLLVALVGVTLLRHLQPHLDPPPRRARPAARSGLRARPRPAVRLGGIAGRCEGVPLAVLPNPSGRNASVSPDAMLSAFRRLRRTLMRLRTRRERCRRPPRRHPGVRPRA